MTASIQNATNGIVTRMANMDQTEEVTDKVVKELQLVEVL